MLLTMLLTTTKLYGLASLNDQLITTWSSIRGLPFRIRSVLRPKEGRPLANKAEVELMYLVIGDIILGQLRLVPKLYTYTNKADGAMVG